MLGFYFLRTQTIVKLLIKSFITRLIFHLIRNCIIIARILHDLTAMLQNLIHRVLKIFTPFTKITRYFCFRFEG
jgi:hypothetical protein